MKWQSVLDYRKCEYLLPFPWSSHPHSFFYSTRREVKLLTLYSEQALLLNLMHIAMRQAFCHEGPIPNTWALIAQGAIGIMEHHPFANLRSMIQTMECEFLEVSYIRLVRSLIWDSSSILYSSIPEYMVEVRGDHLSRES